MATWHDELVVDLLLATLAAVALDLEPEDRRRNAMRVRGLARRWVRTDTGRRALEEARARFGPSHRSSATRQAAGRDAS